MKKIFILYYILFLNNLKYLPIFIDNSTIFKFNNKIINKKYYLNLYKRFEKSFTKYNFNITNIEIINNENIIINYDFNGFYSRNIYFFR